MATNYYIRNINDGDLDRLRQIAERRDTSVADLIRKAIRQYVMKANNR